METTNKTVKIVSRNHKYENTWGGYIYDGDFCTSSPQEYTVDRIMSAFNFDKQCKKNLKKRAMTYGYDLK